MNITKRIARYVHLHGTKISTLSRSTGISYKKLFYSLSPKGNGRELNADEISLVCKALGKEDEFFGHYMADPTARALLIGKVQEALVKAVRLMRDELAMDDAGIYPAILPVLRVQQEMLGSVPGELIQMELMLDKEDLREHLEHLEDRDSL